MGKPTKLSRNRVFWSSVIVAVLFGFVVVKLFIIQLVQAEKYQSEALSQWTRNTAVTAKRGEIMDINGTVLAQSATAYKVLIWPNRIQKDEWERVSTELANIEGLNLSYEYIYKRVSNTLTEKPLSEIVLARQLERDVADEIVSLQLGPGVVIATDTKRYYPYGDLLSQVLGFTNKVEGNGQEGLELKYNKYLAGIDGRMLTERDRDGHSIAYGTQEFIPPEDGNDLVLTIDSVVQAFLEKALDNALKVNNAKSAQGIIMNAKTGAIVAIGSLPSFDSNNPPRSDVELLGNLSRNRIVADAYEPGSTFKIITLASALDSGAINTNFTCNCPGARYVNGQRIKCWRSAGHGTQNLTKCADNSCNCAFIDMALAMGTEEFYDYIYKFGFGNTTGSGLGSESSGIVTHQKYIRDTDIARIGFGQSIAVTPLQLVSAACAAVNGGNLMQPYIVAKMLTADGKEIFSANPTVVRRVISEQTSKTVREILESVVQNGSGRNAQIAGYRVGGKTGTAQKYENGVIAQGKLIASFIGIAPMDDPEFVCLILVDEPQVGVIFGSTVAAPFVKQALEETLRYYGFAAEGSEETVMVPDLYGKTVSEAQQILEDVGLNATFQATDKIVNQIPQPGEMAIKGTDVLLYTESTSIVITEDTVSMISFIGMTRLEAYDKLKEMGLKMEISGTYSGGLVTWQSIGYDKEVEFGATITLVFGSE
ncbi:MAG: PASTA domain-containing protein [Clostridiales bacterium]|jgi:stage V sporulation protein D (sporulation-specific penicillin-binding protein)|nr:PASTA domain-containing protein [Clostridiales bacterium]